VLTGTITGLVIRLLARAGWHSPRVADIVSWWYRRLCRVLGLRLVVRGTPERPALLIANHVSWLDIPVLGAQGPAAFLAKAEIGAWPLIGWMAWIAETLFIERGANQAPALIAAVGGRVRDGRSVVVFPEGTTSDGTGLLRFHPRLFAAARESRAPMQPVAIRYGTNEAPDATAPFIGDDSLVPHLLRVLRHEGLRVEVSFLPVIETIGLDRRALAERSRTAIATALGIDANPPARRRSAELADARPGPASPAECRSRAVSR
jgi:1-acyl-sn-glycerol-3-phosphate acyltransferase